MKIEYRIKGSEQGFQILADFSDVVKDWKPDSGLGSVQRENLAAAVGQNNNAFRQPLGNITTKFHFNIITTKASDTAASVHAATIQNALLGTKIILKSTVGTDVRFYDNTVVHRACPTFDGSTIEWDIEAEGDLVTDQEPT